MTINSKPVAKLVTFGRGGDTVHYAKGHTCTGYGSPDRPHAAKGEEIPDGCPVIDMRAAIETDEGFNWVFRGPMVNVDLPLLQVDPCPKPSAVMLSGLEGAFGQLAALAEATTSNDPGPLDMVSLAGYVEGWRKYGATIGHYENGQIIWEVN